MNRGVPGLGPLDQKLLRDLWRIKGQALAIAAVIAVGVALLVMMQGLIGSLQQTKDAYFDRYRFAEVFAPVKRAPRTVLADLGRIDGVAAVEGRIIGAALLDLPGSAVPVRAQAVSLPEFRPPALNDIHMTRGQKLEPGRDDQVILLDSFAKARGFGPGDRLTVNLNGARRTLRIVGLAMSPEFVYAVAPGEIAPNDARFAVLWMNQTALEAAYDLDGAFNEALLSLRGGRPQAALERLDLLLAPYGTTGAYARKDQVSNRFLTEEIAGLRASGRAVPPIFLGTAAFLLFIVISRMVQAERESIGLMKAFGYTSSEIAAHYLKLVIIIAAAGAALGCLLGVALGHAMAETYRLYYKFPFLDFQVSAGSVFVGFVVSLLAALVSGLVVLRGVFGLSPAVAMRPPAPQDFSRTRGLVESFGRSLDQPSRMVLRRLFRQPVRALAATIAIAAGMSLAVAMLSVMGGFDQAIRLSFTVIDRSDATVSFVEPLSEKVLLELQSMPGVISVEPFRVTPAILRHGTRSYRGAVDGLIAEPRLRRAIDEDQQPIYIRSEGVVLGAPLAKILDIHAGQTLTVDVREGRRPVLEVPVVGVAETLLGAPAYMELGTLSRALGEPGRVSGAHLQIDSAHSDAIYAELKAMPAVAGVSLRREAQAAFQELMDTGAGAARFVMAGFAGIIAFGIVYNTARVALTERSRDLASLRVLGFTRGEAAFVLLGEIAVVTLLALPIGSLLGYFLTRLVAIGFSTDLYQIPVTVVPESHGVAAIAVLLAAAISGYLVKRDADRIDMVSALKIRE